MSHHFDTPTAHEDPRINLCDFSLLAGAPGATGMLMTDNPDAGPSALDHFRDEGFFANRNVTAIVLEVPNAIICEGRVRAWATISPYGHAPEVQVSRWSSPLLTDQFMSDNATKERFNRSTPADAQAEFTQHVASVVEKVADLEGAVAGPAGRADHIVARAAFTTSDLNVGALDDDAMDVMLSPLTGTALSDGATPPAERMRPDFPYFGAPYSAVEQEGVAPARPAPHPA